MKIGEKLKEKRTAAGLSQEALSERIGVSRQTISSWENDRSYPDIGSILKLSDLYSLSLDELLKEDENMRKHVEKASAFSERLWTYLFILTIMLIPLASILERCLSAVTAARILTAAAMVIMPFLLNARHQIFGEDRVIKAILVVVWVAIGISGAYFLVFGWILIYHTMLNRKGASFWLAILVYFAVPIGIFIGQKLPTFLEEGIYQQPPQLFGHTYRLESNDKAYTMLELEETGNRLILDGTDMGTMEFEAAETGSSSWGTWVLIPNGDSLVTAFTIEVDRHFLPTFDCRTADEWRWGTLYQIPDATMVLRTDRGDHSLNIDWYSARMLPENADELNSVTLTEQGSAAIVLELVDDAEPVKELTVTEEYHHAGQVDIRNYTLTRDENGQFPFPEPLAKRYEGNEQFAVYSIAWDGGEYLFRVDYE